MTARLPLRSIVSLGVVVLTLAACPPPEGNPDGGAPDPKTLTIAVSKGGDGLGEIVSEPEGIDCDTTCDAQEHDFEIGGEVVLTAAPARDALFGGWSCLLQGGNTRTGADPSIVASLPEDEEGALISCEPLFRQLYTIVFIFPGAGTGEGSVTGSLTKSDGSPRLECRSDDGVVCDAGYFAGEVDTFTAVADEGSVFSRWGFDCGTGSDPTTVTMDEDKNCEAYFE
jgi:Divergent InlB B-repeat domain